MNFDPTTRVAVVTGPGPQITGTVLDNDRDGHITVLLDSGETVLGNDGDFYELLDGMGRVLVDDGAHRPAVGLRQFAEGLDPNFRGFYTWGPVFLAVPAEDGAR